MRSYKVMGGLLIALLLSACSPDWPQRLGYHALQNAGQLQCQKAMANDCERRQSYDEYQHERARVH